MTLRALVFDFDGTILDTEVPVYTAWNAEFRRLGSELPLARWLTVVGSAEDPDWMAELAELAVERGVAFDAEAVAERRRATRDRMLAASGPRPGVVAMLEQAVEAELGLAVASSSSSDWVVPHLETFGLSDYFSVVMTVDQVDRGKPAPDLFLRAAEGLDVSPRCCVAIEDSHHGVTSANAAGMVSVAVPNEITRHQTFEHAAHTVASLAELDLAALAALATPVSGC